MRVRGVTAEVRPIGSLGLDLSQIDDVEGEFDERMEIAIPESLRTVTVTPDTVRIRGRAVPRHSHRFPIASVSVLTLGIETSCDDTSIALLEDQTALLANVVSSQVVHAAYGGVVPELASRAHVSEHPADLRAGAARRRASIRNGSTSSA